MSTGFNSNFSFFQPKYFSENYFFDCSLDPEDWFDNFDFQPVGKVNDSTKRFIWRAYNLQREDKCPLSIKYLTKEWKQESVSAFISLDDGLGLNHALDKHSDNQHVYAFNILGKTRWELPWGLFELVPGDMLIVPPNVEHQVTVLEYPRISFGLHNESKS